MAIETLVVEKQKFLFVTLQDHVIKGYFDVRVGIEHIIVLVCRVISQGHVIKWSYNLIGSIPSS